MNSIATAEVFNIFPFDLAFSMTIHKAKGRTIPKVVLDLFCHPTKYAKMNFAAIFVAMSRVKNKEDIRLLSHTKEGDTINMVEAYSYITQLSPSDYVMAFYHGYERNQSNNNHGNVWSPRKALSFERT